MADFSRGVCRFVIGLAKKVLISNQVALIADTVFDSGPASTATAWIGAVAYALQIYYDFSGYSDMAIGLGWMFGFHFDENFNLPYISKSVSEFWRRWHISLGTWFRDYVYFPLGGSRVKSRGRLIFNLFVVWGLTGLWHGASWNFVLWGLYFFLFIAAEKLFFAKQFKENRFSLPTRCFLHLYTLLVVLFGWVALPLPYPASNGGVSQGHVRASSGRRYRRDGARPVKRKVVQYRGGSALLSAGGTGHFPRF